MKRHIKEEEDLSHKMGNVTESVEKSALCIFKFKSFTWWQW